jgi:membrane protease YdiL (CAAX protease family)
MIQARLAAGRRAALLTSLVLAAAFLRALLLPFGDLLSTLVFAGCLLAITLFEYPLPALPTRGRETSRPSPWGAGWRKAEREQWGRGWSLIPGILTGALLVAPVMTSPLSGRPPGAFWSWAAIAALLATLEETAIRGALYRHWLRESGTIAAVGIGAIVFALIHLPRYGWPAMPLDLTVGLALGGLRALTGRVLPCAIAHTIADWGAWWWL